MNTENRQWLNHQNPLIIAELGTSHNGDIIKAREMISAAAQSGADCIKFQIVFADEILHPKTGEISLPGGTIRLYDRFKQLEMPEKFYVELKDYAESRGLLFLCTPFGPKSARILKNLNPKMVKIASPELNYTDLLEEVSRWDIPILLSSGVSNLGDIEETLAVLNAGAHAGDDRTCSRADGRPDCHSICLLHCVTSYPAPESEYNVRVLGNLSRIFGIPAGISDHSLDPELVPVLALTQGAVAIEKHFCLSRSDPGLDDPIALPPDQFSRMVHAVRGAQKAGPEATLSEMSVKWGKSKIESILGNGVKTLAPSEKMNYSRTNRSIHAIRDIEAGQTLTPDDFRVLRTEKVLRPGLPPSWAHRIAGRKARQFIPDGEGIRFEDLA
ncbi:MAG: N-acetylneuraminate synthase family protein [Treponema sp.]|nr:N-acetylneuraminate synthase family protein [Treponema sp.]